MEIRGLKAMIVGGASGMARATAERIAAGGGTVAILDRQGSAGPDVANALDGTFHACDILDHDGLEHVIAEAVEALGGLHAAVNTAVVASRSAPCPRTVRTRSTTSGG